jgi:hypothetical protein
VGCVCFARVASRRSTVSMTHTPRRRRRHRVNRNASQRSSRRLPPWISRHRALLPLRHAPLPPLLSHTALCPLSQVRSHAPQTSLLPMGMGEGEGEGLGVGLAMEEDGEEEEERGREKEKEKGKRKFRGRLLLLRASWRCWVLWTTMSSCTHTTYTNSKVCQRERERREKKT